MLGQGCFRFCYMNRHLLKLYRWAGVLSKWTGVPAPTEALPDWTGLWLAWGECPSSHQFHCHRLSRSERCSPSAQPSLVAFRHDQGKCLSSVCRRWPPVPQVGERTFEWCLRRGTSSKTINVLVRPCFSPAIVQESWISVLKFIEICWVIITSLWTLVSHSASDHLVKPLELRGMGCFSFCWLL